MRDREPVPAVTRAEVDASPALVRELARLTNVRRALLELPELAAPPGVFDRALAAAERRRRRGLVWVRSIGAAAAIAALLVGAAVYVVTTETPDSPTPAAVALERTALPSSPPSYVTLVAQSEELEQILNRMPRRPLMSGRTASTIVGLEDRIALIDEQLSYGAARGLRVPQREALWQERVDLMSALVHVRYAQAEGPAY